LGGAGIIILVYTPPAGELGLKKMGMKSANQAHETAIFQNILCGNRQLPWSAPGYLPKISAGKVMQPVVTASPPSRISMDL